MHKSVADTSVITCDEIISAIDIVSATMTNTITANVSINSDDKIVRYCFILHIVLLVILLPLIITIICSLYVKHSSRRKNINDLTV